MGDPHKISPTSGKAGFWQMPPRWVWLLCLGSMVIFSASMVTWWEGMRFQSRPLEPPEHRIVTDALETWESLAQDEDDQAAVIVLREMLKDEIIRAMDEKSFGRKAERITLGYTDERGRILLNPHICFSAYYALGEHRTDGVHTADLVRTLTTLHHEYQHRAFNATEEQAYELEWSFTQRCLHRAQRRGMPGLERELREWEQDMAERVELYVGQTRFEQLRGKLSRLPSEG